MNPAVEATLYDRAKLLHNLEKIVSSASKNKQKHAGQMSLFGEDETYTEVTLEEPPRFNPLEISEMEREVLGISLLYSEYEPYETIRCRYCDSTLTEIFGTEFEGNKTFLAKLTEIDHRVSNFGNPFAKLRFTHDGTESRMYLFGNLYKKNLLKCFVNKIYLITVCHNKERGSMDLVDFMQADSIKNLRINAVWASAPIGKLHLLKTYLYCHMMGNDYPVNIHVQDKEFTFMGAMRCNIDNENLVEMRKQGITIKLR